jgi:hypothetical protein
MNSAEKLRWCPRCGETKPERGFARDRSKASGFKSHCKDCDALRAKLRYEQVLLVLSPLRNDVTIACSP